MRTGSAALSLLSPACFSHFLLLNDFPPPSWSLEQANWRGAGSVDYLAFKTSIKPGMLCFHASQIWSHLICGRRLQMLWTDIYWNRVCVKVYEIRVFKV